MIRLLGYCIDIGLIVLVLGASNIRLIIENWMKYGLLIGFPHSHIPTKDYAFFFFAWLCVPLSLVISLVTEYGMGRLAVFAKDAQPDYLKKLFILERVVALTHVAHLTFLLTFPSYLAYTQIYHPVGKVYKIFKKKTCFKQLLIFF
jgi:diacylglycerol O-acyltransferase-1